MSAFLIINYQVSVDYQTQEYLREIRNKTWQFSAKISSDPVESSTSKGKYNFDLTNLKIISNDTDIDLAGHYFVQLSNQDLERADTIYFEGELSDAFGNYYASIYQAKLLKIEKSGNFFLMIRNNFASQIKKFISAPQSGLGIGYLLGQKSGVAQEIQDTLRTVGLTHIIVASGAHLSTLVGFSRKIFGKVSRFFSTVMAFLAMCFFLGITGLSASMLRASLVTSLSLILSYYGRKINPLRLIILVAAATLIYNPFYLNNLSWLLSFSSFVGILVIAPKLTQILYGKNQKPNFVVSTVISSVSASLPCSPILLYYFGQISLISVIANVLILPTISYAMGLTFLTGLLGYFAPFFAQICGKIACFILDYQINVATYFAKSEAFLIEIPAENPLVFLLYLPLALIMVIYLVFRFYHAYACRRTFNYDNLKLS